MIKKIILIILCLLGARMLRASDVAALKAENEQLRSQLAQRTVDQSTSIAVAVSAMVVGGIAVWYYDRQLPNLEEKISNDQIIKVITTHEGSGQEMVDKLVTQCCAGPEKESLKQLIGKMDQSIELLERYLQWKTPQRFDRFAWAEQALARLVLARSDVAALFYHMPAVL